MILTNEYQFIGRSNAAVSQGNSCSYYLLLYAKTSADPATGRHTVRVLTRLACNASRNFFNYYTSGNITIDGNSVDSWFWNLVPNAEWNEDDLTQSGVTYEMWTDLREGELTIDVGFGMEKELQIGASWVFNASDKIDWLPQPNVTASVTATVTLPAIAAASQPTASAQEIELGQSVTVYTNRVSDFKHLVTYEFAGISGVIADDVADFCVWEPLMALAQQIPNAAAGTAVITCTTYAGETPIGSNQVLLTLRIPEDVVPTVSAAWQDASGALDALDTLVQNVSRLAVEVTGTGIYGSSVTSAAVSLNGKPYAGGEITDAGELLLEASVTDSRGRIGTAVYPITVAAYAPPALTLNASRCQEDGTADDTGEFALVTVTGSVTDVEGRNASGLILTYGGRELTLDSAVGEFTTQKIIPADSTRTLSLRAALSDRLLTAERSMTLSTGYATLDLLKGGKGIAFGKSATREGFECAMPAFFTGGIEGVAPGGFGLGSTETMQTISTWDQLQEVRPSGWYRYTASIAGIRNWAVRVDSDGTNLYQTLYAIYKGNMVVQRRTYTGGKWIAEWENPPMGRNTEYRTTERWTGKPVYTKQITFGILPNTGAKGVETGIDSLSDVIRIDGYVKDSGSQTWNALYSHGHITDVWVIHSDDGKYVGIKTAADLSDREAFVQIWYTKD